MRWRLFAGGTVANQASMKLRFPSLIDYDDVPSQELMDFALLDAVADVDETRWGGPGRKFERGLEYLAAHYLTKTLADSEGGSLDAFPISAATADGVSQTLAVPSDIPADLAPFYTTRYGLEYLRLLRMHWAGPVLV